MIILSILIHLLGNYLPKWFLPKNKQNNPALKLSGLFFDFLIAFLILFIIHLSSPKTSYIRNDDAIYGLEFNKTMQQLGFENGDKVISINNQSIEKISEITNLILLNSNSVVKVKRKNNYTEIKINDEEKLKILQSKGIAVKAKQGEKIQEIKQTQEKFSFKKVLKSYQNNIKGAYSFIIPKKDYKKISGINITTNGLKEKISFLAFCCIIVGLLNLIPLPGFSLGNFIISLIEFKRNKPFRGKSKKIAGISTVFIVIIILIAIHY